MFEIDEIKRKGQVFYYSNHEAALEFEKIYLDTRAREGRIYDDNQLSEFPKINPGHKLFDEWRIRKLSLLKLMNYLKKTEKTLKIMDLGCGNGWLANHLSKIPFSKVYAIDINRTELIQGARVFRDSTNLKFIYGDIFQNIFEKASFDIIIAASSVQYFHDLSGLIKRLLTFLKPDGELHLIDSHLYNSDQMEETKTRTKRYYEEFGFPRMSAFYFHHLTDDLKKFNYTYLYNPISLKEKIRKKLFSEINSPFPWIKIIK